MRKKQIKWLWNAIRSFDELMERYHRYEYQSWYSRGMRPSDR